MSNLEICPAVLALPAQGKRDVPVANSAQNIDGVKAFDPERLTDRDGSHLAGMCG
jgi:hypothetical protein